MPKPTLPSDVVRVFRHKAAPEMAWYSKTFLEHYAASVLSSFNSSDTFPRNCLLDVTVSLSFEGLKPGQHALSFTGKGLPALLKLFPALHKHHSFAKKKRPPLDAAHHDDWRTSLDGPAHAPVSHAAAAVSPASSSPIAKSPVVKASLSPSAPAFIPAVAESKSSVVSTASTVTPTPASASSVSASASGTAPVPSTEQKPTEAPFVVVARGAKPPAHSSPEIKTANSFAALAEEDKRDRVRQVIIDNLLPAFCKSLDDSDVLLERFLAWLDGDFSQHLKGLPHEKAFVEFAATLETEFAD
jgi:hypothetical protein